MLYEHFYDSFDTKCIVKCEDGNSRFFRYRFNLHDLIDEKNDLGLGDVYEISLMIFDFLKCFGCVWKDLSFNLISGDFCLDVYTHGNEYVGNLVQAYQWSVKFDIFLYLIFYSYGSEKIKRNLQGLDGDAVSRYFASRDILDNLNDFSFSESIQFDSVNNHIGDVYDYIASQPQREEDYKNGKAYHLTFLNRKIQQESRKSGLYETYCMMKNPMISEDEATYSASGHFIMQNSYGNYWLTKYNDLVNSHWMYFPPSKEEIKEKKLTMHHIMLRSEYPQLENDRKNIVWLNFADHMMAHYYLWQYDKRYALGLWFGCVYGRKNKLWDLPGGEKEYAILKKEVAECRKLIKSKAKQNRL